jgi:hypothetical protein
MKIRKYILILLVCLIVFTGIYFIKPVNKIEASPILIVGSELIIVASIMVIAGFVFATDEDMQKAASDFYAQAPQTFRNKVTAMLTSQEFIDGVVGISMDLAMIQDVADYVIANYAGIQTQVSAFSRWWNAQFTASQISLVPNTQGIFNIGGLTGQRPELIQAHVDIGVGQWVDQWGVTDETKAAWLATSVPAGSAVSWQTQYFYVKANTSAVFSLVIVEQTTMHFAMLDCFYTTWNDNQGETGAAVLTYPLDVFMVEGDLTFGQYVTENYAVDVTYGREGVLNPPYDPDRRYGTVIYPYVEPTEVNTPSYAHDIVNTRVIDIPKTTTGTITIPWGGTVEGVPVALTDTGELAITVPEAVSLEIANNQINFNSYRNNWDLLLNKFPFCIPFDLANAIVALYKEPETPEFKIDLRNDNPNVFTGAVPFSMDFTVFDKFIKIVHWGILIIFNVSLILLTRRLIRG